MLYTIWQQSNRKLTYDSVEGSFNFITTGGYVELNGRPLGLANNAFNGDPIQANLTVTGDKGNNQFVPRTITLGDRALQPGDVVLQPIPGTLATPDPYLLPVGGLIEQTLGAGPFKTDLGGNSLAGTPQSLQLWLAGTTTNSLGGTLGDVLVELVDAATDTVIATHTVSGLVSEGNAAYTFQPILIAFARTTVEADVADPLILRISGGSLTDGTGTHSLVVGIYPFPDPVQVLEPAYDASGSLDVNLAFSLPVVRHRLTSIGSLRFLGQLDEDLSVADGVTIDGVDLSAFYQQTSTALAGFAGNLSALSSTSEPIIPSGVAPPSAPLAGVSKWLDTSTPTSPVLKFYTGSAWVPVGLSGPTVDIELRDLVARDLTVTGKLKADLNLDPGVLIGGVDLGRLNQTIAGLAHSSVTDDLHVRHRLQVGEYGAPYILAVDQTVGTPMVSFLPDWQPLAQTFTLQTTTSLHRVLVFGESAMASGSLELRLRRGLPGNAGTDDILALVRMDLNAIDAVPRYYEFLLPSAVLIEKDVPYYFDIMASGSRFTAHTSAGSDAYAAGQLYRAPDNQDDFAALDPVTDGDLMFQLEVGTTLQGELDVMGTIRFLNDLSLGTVPSLLDYFANLADSLGTDPATGIKPDFTSTYFIGAGDSAVEAINRLDAGLQDVVDHLGDTPAGGDASGPLNDLQVVGIGGHPLADTAPNADEVLKYDGTQWVPTPIAALTKGIQVRFDFKHVGALSTLLNLHFPLEAADGMRPVGRDALRITEVLIALQDPGMMSATVIDVLSGVPDSAPVSLFVSSAKPGIPAMSGLWKVASFQPDTTLLPADSYLTMDILQVASGAYDLTVSVICEIL